MRKIYLAIPYSGMEEQSFSVANQVAGQLMAKGYCVYSPISQNHPVAAAVDLPTDWDFWKRLDEPFIEWCDILVVVELTGWRSSVGVTEEIRIARDTGKPVKLFKLASGELVDLHTAKPINLNEDGSVAIKNSLALAGAKTGRFTDCEPGKYSAEIKAQGDNFGPNSCSESVQAESKAQENDKDVLVAENFTEREKVIMQAAFTTGRIFVRSGEVEKAAVIQKRLKANCERAIDILLNKGGDK